MLAENGDKVSGSFSIGKLKSFLRKHYLTPRDVKPGNIELGLNSVSLERLIFLMIHVYSQNTEEHFLLGH